MSEKHSLLYNLARKRARRLLREKTKAAQGEPPEYQPRTLDEVLEDKEAEG